MKPIIQYSIVAFLFTLSACGGGSSSSSTHAANISSVSFPGAPSSTQSSVSSSVAPSSTQSSLTAKEKITALENSGAITTLKRSSDVKGPDANANGVRDDVDIVIATMPINESQKIGAEQFAKSIQAALVLDVSDTTKLRDASVHISRAIQCLSSRFPDKKQLTAVANTIESITANTKERASQYIKFNVALSGSVSKLLSGDTCDE